MKSGFYKERIYPILFMVIVTVVCILPVAAISLSTADLVERNEFLFLKKAVLYAAGIPVPEEGEAVEKLFQARVRSVKNSRDEVKYFEVRAEGAAAGTAPAAYVLPTAGPGLWGEIEAVVGFLPNLTTLTGVDFTKQNETPWLGARITEDWFKEQFRGKQGPFVMVPEGQAQNANEVDAITGASRTSRFVLDILNGSGARIQQLTTEGE